MTTNAENKKDRRYRAVQYAGWLLAVLITFTLSAPQNANSPLHVPNVGFGVYFGYLFGVNIVPLTALAAGISSWRRLKSFGSVSLLVYSAIILIIINIREVS